MTKRTPEIAEISVSGYADVENAEDEHSRRRSRAWLLLLRIQTRRIVNQKNILRYRTSQDVLVRPPNRLID